MLPELTVGHVAGIIAACMVVLQFFCPTILTYVLAGFLRDTENASTWTLASANLLSSSWPTILRTDSTSSAGRARTIIRVICKAVPVMLLLCAITGIVTPLGLGQELTALPARVGTFEYAKDDSPYGLGTSPRGQYALSRICNGERGGRSAILAPCPYSNSEVVYVDRPDGGGFHVELPNGYNTSIPDELKDIFSSGNSGSTVSSFFDIEWRQVSKKADWNLDDAEIPVGLFRPLDSVILENKYKIAEGLIIDATVGGIGFRNHTIPVGLSRGATWEEDILFIEPSTACVNTNLTLDFDMVLSSNLGAGDIKNLMLTDRGGFFQMNTTFPTLQLLDSQTNPDLQKRAYHAAWLNNAFTMLYLNVTNEKDKPARGMKAFSYMDSALDKGFPMPHHNIDRYQGLRLSPDFGNYLRLGETTPDSGGRNYSNPFNISRVDFDSVNRGCSGTIPDNPANISNIYVSCGILRGAPRRTDGGPQLVFESGSKWSSPLHACASSLRATIKTARFSVNGTGLAGLQVLGVTPKTYASDADAPLWGLEDWGIRLDNYAPVWGLVSPEHASRENVTTIRKPDFHLIGTPLSRSFVNTLNIGPQANNLAGASFAQAAMNTVFHQVAESKEEWPMDLRGAASMSIFSRWQTLSQDAARAGQIINLMWTDVVASAVVGTRGVLGEVNSGKNPAGPILVRPTGSRITYDVRFGIPGALLLLWLSAITATAVCCTFCCGGRVGFKTLARRINQLSVGRVFTTFLHPEQSTLTMSAKQWRGANGLKTITLKEVACRDGEGEYIHPGNVEGVADTYQLLDGHKR